jgi:hypothetical protein
MYTTPQVAVRCNVPVRKVISWTEHGYVYPSVPANGHGSKRQWSASDVKLCKVLAKLEPMYRVSFLKELFE